jgi:IS5 family transposase
MQNLTQINALMIKYPLNKCETKDIANVQKAGILKAKVKVAEMRGQQSFADAEYANRKKKTKREKFLEIMDHVIPWDEWVGIIRPYYPKGERGRPPKGEEIMLRMFLLSEWFNLSDEGVEDAIYDSYAFRKFMGINFIEEQAPDATTLCLFRKLLNDNGIAKLFFESTKQFLEKHGKLMHGGTIVDATILDAPTSTKNEEKKRDPEMSSVKKGNQWYFGERLHIGADAGTGYIHSTEVTAASAGERDVVPLLVREDDEVVYGDAGYCGIEKRDEIRQSEHLSKIDWRVKQQTPYRKNKWDSGPGIYWLEHFRQQNSRVRAKVEYAFLVIKRIFGYRKVRYRGLHKNRCHAHSLCALANLYMFAQANTAGVT